MPSSTILVLQTSPASTAAQGTLTGVGYQVTTTADPDDAVRRAADFALVIVDVGSGLRSGVDVCREIRGTGSLSAIPVLCVSQTDDVEERVRFLQAGADDVIARPFDPRELEARVEALLIRFQRSRDLSPLALAEDATLARRSILAFFSPKGGVGTTTIAVNVATLLAARAPGRVLLMDLDLQFGQVATHLNLKPQLTVAELAHDEQSLREGEMLRAYAMAHESGLAVLAAPGTPEAGRLITPEQVTLAVSTARATYDTLVIDAGSELNEQSLAVLERAESVVIPLVPEIGALKALHSLLEYLAEVGLASATTTFVLNHIFAREMLSMRQVEAAIGAKVEVEIPYDAGLYLKAINEGIPVTRSAPTSAPARAMGKLAAAATGVSVDATPGHDEHRGRLGGFRRRG